MKLSGKSMNGDILKTCAVGGITIMETMYEPNLKLPKHRHDLAFFCFTLRGGYTEVDARRTLDCEPSGLVYHPPDETHSVWFQKGAHCLTVQLEAQWLEDLRQQANLTARPADYRGGLLAQLARRLYGEFRAMDDLSPLVLEGLTLEILAEASRKAVVPSNHTPPRWLEQARGLIRERFNERLTLARVAESVSIHPVHLAREFQRYYRCTVGEDIRRQRIELACHKIANSNAPLSEIALAVGFSDQSHFARSFKRLTNMTPTEYRTAFRTR